MLYVTNGNTNDVAVLSVASLQTGHAVLGLIPTGWYPNSVAQRRRQIRVRGERKIPHGTKCRLLLRGRGAFSSVCELQRIESVRPAAHQSRSSVVFHAGAFGAGAVDAAGRPEQQLHWPRRTNGGGANGTMQFLQHHIKHVIYIIKENKTFDQILGDLGIGDGNSALTEFGANITPNEHSLARDFVTLDQFYVSSEVSFDGWAWSTAARVPDIVARHTPVNYAGRGLSYESEGQNRNINVSFSSLADRIADNPATPNDPDVLPGTVDVAAPDGPEHQINTGHLSIALAEVATPAGSRRIWMLRLRGCGLSCRFMITGILPVNAVHGNHLAV